MLEAAFRNWTAIQAPIVLPLAKMLLLMELF